MMAFDTRILFHPPTQHIGPIQRPHPFSHENLLVAEVDAELLPEVGEVIDFRHEHFLTQVPIQTIHLRVHHETRHIHVDFVSLCRHLLWRTNPLKLSIQPPELLHLIPEPSSLLLYSPPQCGIEVVVQEEVGVVPTFDLLPNVCTHSEVFKTLVLLDVKDVVELPAELPLHQHQTLVEVLHNQHQREFLLQLVEECFDGGVGFEVHEVVSEVVDHSALYEVHRVWKVSEEEGEVVEVFVGVVEEHFDRIRHVLQTQQFVELEVVEGTFEL